jgi:hypothetical protein
VFHRPEVARQLRRRVFLAGTGAALVTLAAACGQPDRTPYPFTQTREGHNYRLTDEERAKLQETYKSKMSGG